MIHETLNDIKTDIQELLMKHEVQFKSVRVAHYRESSYFAFEGSYLYLIIDCPFSGTPEFCYVGETTNLGPNLRTHARNHRFSHAFIVDVVEDNKYIREFAKAPLIEKFKPVFQNGYYAFEKHRTNHFEREFSTEETASWIKSRPVKVH